MSTTNLGRPAGRGGFAAAALAACAALVAGPVWAQTEPIATAPASAPAPAASVAPAAKTAPSGIMAVNLVRLLVKRGVITQADADALIQQAEDESKQAQLASAAPPAAPEPPPGVIRVPYVPEVVRNQIRDDIKQDVMAQAKAEGWASPGALPSWINRVEWSGDFRFRDQFNFYSQNNIAPYIDYATFNANGPIDINANTNPNGLPFLDTRANRLNQFSLRARLGAKFEVTDSVALTVRLATGSDNSPVSTTQLLGGGLTKKDIWLDQAYITLTPVDWASASLGRAPNLFMHTDLVFDDNLNLDGVQVTGRKTFDDWGLTMFGEGGAFPLDYVSANFPTDGATKASDSTKWLFAAQAGAKVQPDERSWSARAAVSFYDFDNVQGVLSAPCDLSSGAKQCSSDSSRPSFMQKGNTLFLIRDIIPPANNPLNYAEPQFVGLSYDYRLVDAMAEFELPLFGDTRGQLQADYVRNLAYDPAKALANPLRQPITNFDVNSTYRSGPNALMVKATVGYLHPENRGDWYFSAGYKYIEPDAVLDAFNDHDFHMGGTNARGYFVSAGYYFAKNTWVDARWFSANQVFGPPLAIDVLQLELNTRF